MTPFSMKGTDMINLSRGIKRSIRKVRGVLYAVSHGIDESISVWIMIKTCP